MHTRLDYGYTLDCTLNNYDCSACADRLNEDPGCYQRCKEILTGRCEVAQRECPSKYKFAKSQCVNLDLKYGRCLKGTFGECEMVWGEECVVQNDDPG